MKILIVTITAAITLSSCSLFKPKIEYITVPVPVIQTVEVPTIERPTLVIETLTEEEKSKDGEIAKAYISSLIQLIGYSERLESIINSIREQTKK